MALIANLNMNLKKIKITMFNNSNNHRNNNKFNKIIIINKINDSIDEN